MNALDSLRTMTTVVADTGDLKQIEKYRPQEATTNPSLIFQSAQNPEYVHLIDEAVLYGKKSGGSKESQMHVTLDEVFVLFAKEITKIIPGRVSVEVDARLSFDVEGSVTKAVYLIERFKAHGIPKERILIKLASTWEGFLAAKQLEEKGIHCNMTLLFSLTQALRAHDVKATLISPFVGRILDWYKKNEGKEYTAAEDPGVLSVKELYSVLKAMGSKVQIMGASFRNAGEIEELSGCDFLTIAPKFLEEFTNNKSQLQRKLSPSGHENNPQAKGYKPMSEKEFRFALNENAMATEKLAEGIRLFSVDIRKLQKILEEKL